MADAVVPEPEKENIEETPETEPVHPEPEKQEDKQPIDSSVPEPAPQKTTSSSDKGFKKYLNIYTSHKKWSIPLTVLAVLIVILAIPFTRYSVLALFISEHVSVSVTDSTTGTGVSGALVQINNLSGKTNSAGKLSIKVPVGNKTISISKQYYKAATQKVFVSLSKTKDNFSINLVATGRQVTFKVLNTITGQSVKDADLKILDTEAKTDTNGNATIVLPANKSSEPGVISTSGYNDASVTLVVTSKITPANTFKITPSGKVYFLSDLSGKLDVVKTNLDGTARQTVLAGTGLEDIQNTVLLASRDWKYLVLYSVRSSGSNDELNLIDTTNNDKVTNIEAATSGDTYTAIGWQNGYFVYSVYRSNVEKWQPAAASIKSFNPQNAKIAVLDSTSANGSSNNDAQYETYGTVAEFNGQVVFYKNWYAYPGYLSVSGKQDTLNAINPDGSGKKTISSIDASQLYFGEIYQYAANQLLISSDTSSSSAYSSTYYTYDTSGSYNKSSNQYPSTAVYPTYLLSPSSSHLFWSIPQDGKNGLYVSDPSGNNKTQVASLSDYSAYGWYTDNYLLVSKNSSELYIMPASGGTALKITDYHKPAQSFNGYGGGYGGL